MNEDNVSILLKKSMNKKLDMSMENVVMVFILFGFIYYFLFMKFHFFYSFVCSILVSYFLYQIYPVSSVIYIIIYLYTITRIYHEKNNLDKGVIKETDIIKNGKPMNGSLVSYTITPNQTQSMTNNFTYQFFIYINGFEFIADNEDYKNTWVNYRKDDWKKIYHRGDDLIQNPSGMQFPGVWLSPKINNLYVLLKNGQSEESEMIEIKNIPLNEWIDIHIVLEGTNIQIYLNGNLEQNIVLQYEIPSNINSKNIYLGQKRGEVIEGWPGLLAEMSYHPYSFTNEEIYKSHEYFKKIVNEYQNKLLKNKKIKVPSTISENGDSVCCT